MNRMIALFFLVAGALLLPGCGSSFPATTPVTGTLTFQGAPVEGATVLFGRGARNSTQGEIALSKTDDKGQFTLKTHFGSQGDVQGAVPGDYQVTVSKLMPPAGMSQARYTALVEAAKKIGESGGMVPVNKQPPPLVEMFPPSYALAGKTTLSAQVTPAGPNHFTFDLK